MPYLTNCLIEDIVSLVLYSFFSCTEKYLFICLFGGNAIITII